MAACWRGFCSRMKTEAMAGQEDVDLWDEILNEAAHVVQRCWRAFKIKLVLGVNGKARKDDVWVGTLKFTVSRSSMVGVGACFANGRNFLIVVVVLIVVVLIVVVVLICVVLIVLLLIFVLLILLFLILLFLILLLLILLLLIFVLLIFVLDRRETKTNSVLMSVPCCGCGVT